MKTRKKMLLLSAVCVVLFTIVCLYLIFIDKTLSDALIDKFFNYCIWIVIGSGICGVASKRNERIKDLHSSSNNDGEEELSEESTEEEENIENEEIMHGDEI